MKGGKFSRKPNCKRCKILRESRKLYRRLYIIVSINLLNTDSKEIEWQFTGLSLESFLYRVIILAILSLLGKIPNKKESLTILGTPLPQEQPRIRQNPCHYCVSSSQGGDFLVLGIALLIFFETLTKNLIENIGHFLRIISFFTILK